MDKTTSDILILHEDPLRTYSDAEEERLTANLLDLTHRIHRGHLSDQAIRPSLLKGLHYHIFAGVREFAGLFRAPGSGSEYVTFGPNRSVPSKEVEGELESVFSDVRKSLTSLENNPDHPEYAASAIWLAAWTHAEVIRVHPFEDGNGRAARALMNLLLVRLGLRPIPIEVPKQEYLGCLNHYFRSNDLQTFVDLCIRISTGVDPLGS